MSSSSSGNGSTWRCYTVAARSESNLPRTSPQRLTTKPFKDDELTIEASLDLSREEVIALVSKPQEVPDLPRQRVDVKLQLESDYWRSVASCVRIPGNINSRTHEEAAQGVLQALDLPMLEVVLHRYDAHRLANVEGLTAQELDPDSVAAHENRGLVESAKCSLAIGQRCNCAQEGSGRKKTVRATDFLQNMAQAEQVAAPDAPTRKNAAKASTYLHKSEYLRLGADGNTTAFFHSNGAAFSL
jgi:hypothetical protein